MKLTVEQRKFWGEYLRATADRVGLRDWTFRLQRSLIEDEADDENKIYGAQVDFIDGRRLADVKLGEAFVTRMTPAEQRHAIVHELMHCHFSAAWRHVEHDLDVFLGKPTYIAFFDSFERNMEFGLDAVTDALERHVPLPPGKKPAKAKRRAYARPRRSTTRKTKRKRVG